MSIVEKAVGRNPSGKSRLRPAEQPKKRGSAGQGPQASVAPEDLAASGLYVLDSDPVAAKEFRFLKRPVMARIFGNSRSGSAPGNVVMVTSDLPQVGKSFISMNLAASIAKEQLTSVVLVDADAVRRTLSLKLGLGDRPGMLDVLAEHDVQLEDVLVDSGLPELTILPAGHPRPNSTELLGSRRAGDMLRVLEGQDSIIILDAPPILPTSEARAAIDKVQHAIIVVEAGRSTTSELDAMLKMLQGSTASISMVLNKAPRSSRTPQLYSYEY